MVSDTGSDGREGYEYRGIEIQGPPKEGNYVAKIKRHNQRTNEKSSSSGL